MPTNMDRYQADLESLLGRASKLQNSLRFECLGKGFRDSLSVVAEKLPENMDLTRAQVDAKMDKLLRALPSFKDTYQTWYTEAHAFIIEKCVSE